MNDEMKALAQRAVASKHWRWMPGMLSDDEVRVCYIRSGRVWVDIPDDFGDGPVLRSDFDGYMSGIPDLTDPATLGCLLHLVREAWSSKCFARPTHDGFTVMRGSGAGMGKISDGRTEAEALVAALEAAS
jgi:hypothetical protein